jgi:site-specific DNA recombinase
MNLDGYIRVSHGRGDKLISGTAQREKIEAFCALHGLHIAAWHEDLDEPGSKAARLGFQRAIARVEARETDGIIVAKLDRFAPGMAAAATAIRRIHDANGQLVSVEDNFDTDTATPSGKFALHMIEVLAQLELDRVRDTWARAQESAVRRGIHVASRLPTGYRRGADGRLEPVETAAPVIADVFRRRAAGASWKELAGILEDAGVVGPYASPTWTTGAVRSIIENPVYTGQARSGQHRKDGAHPALVSAEEWRAAQLTRPTVSPLRSPAGALLAGLLRCAGCRYVMKSDTITGRDGKLRQYRCRGEHAAGRCPNPTSVLAHVVEPHVVAAFLAALGPDGVLTRPASNRADITRARRVLAEAEAELAAWIEAVSVREVGRDAYTAGLIIRQQRRKESQQALDAVAGCASVGLPALPDVPALWPGLSTDDRRRLLATGIDAVMLRRGRDITARTLILWAGQAPADLPARGRRVPLASFAWPDDLPTRARGAVA